MKQVYVHLWFFCTYLCLLDISPLMDEWTKFPAILDDLPVFCVPGVISHRNPHHQSVLSIYTGISYVYILVLTQYILCSVFFILAAIIHDRIIMNWSFLYILLLFLEISPWYFFPCKQRNYLKGFLSYLSFYWNASFNPLYLLCVTKL